MSETLSSGLTLIIPSQGDVNWATSIKDNCFQKISEHDHTGSGKGLAIGTAAIANLAVTEAKLASSAVTTTKIADNSVTLGKLFPISSDRLLGRDTAGVGNVESIALTGGLGMDGFNQLTINSVDGAIITLGTIPAGALASNAVTTAKILDGNVTEAKLADDAASRSTLICDINFGAFGDGTTALVESTGTLRPIPKALKVTHLSITNIFDENITSGTFTITLYKNRVSTGKTVTLTAGQKTNYVAIAAESFAAGNIFSLAITQASIVTPATASSISACAWGHFTE